MLFRSGLEPALGNLTRHLLERAAARTAVVAMGSPYLAQEFPEVQTYLCTFSHERVSELSAARALFGEIAIRGRLPVSIPGIAARGAGLERPAPEPQAPGGPGGFHANSPER